MYVERMNRAPYIWFRSICCNNSFVKFCVFFNSLWTSLLISLQFHGYVSSSWEGNKATEWCVECGDTETKASRVPKIDVKTLVYWFKHVQFYLFRLKIDFYGLICNACEIDKSPFSENDAIQLKDVTTAVECLITWTK